MKYWRDAAYGRAGVFLFLWNRSGLPLFRPMKGLSWVQQGRGIFPWIVEAEKPIVPLRVTERWQR
jgi:hypothetical protein